MNGEIPSVPITTLAGIASLTDLLPEMPLPSPLPQTLSNKSLLFHPRVAEEAHILLSLRDDALVPQLVQSLAQTSSDHIELKDHYTGAEPPVEEQNTPELLKAILHRNPNVFKGPAVNSAKGVVPPEVNHSAPTPAPALILTPAPAVIPALMPAMQASTRQASPATLPIPTALPATPAQAPVPVCDKTPAPALAPGFKMELVMAGASNAPTNGILTPPHSSGVARLEHTSTSSTNFTDLSPAHTSSAPVEGIAKLPLPLPPTPVTPITPATHATPTTTSAESRLREPRVMLSRIRPEDEALMQRSLKEFQERAPSRAKEMGLSRNHKRLRVESGSDSDEEPKNKTKYFKARDKERELQRRKEKDQRKKTNDDDEYLVDGKHWSVNSKRRRMRNAEPDPANEENSNDSANVRKTKFRKIERKMVPVLEKLSNEELMETNLYQRFNRSIEQIFNNTDDVELTLDASADLDDDAPSEAMIAKYQLQDLCGEAAKLKTLGAMESIPSERITRLLSILEKNIRDGTKVSPIADPDDDEDERKMWMELAMERVMRAVDASLTTLYILTSPNMHKRVYLEDVIDRVVIFTKFQLLNTIFPSFDPVYRDSKNKDGVIVNARKKRAHTKEVREKSLLNLYNKLAEVVSLLAELLSIQTLTDTAVLHISSMGISPFFVEGVSELQLSALKLVTNIFTKYEKHRKLLLDDILASMARLPSSKRSLRSYRLNFEEQIQMLTALVLQLIQCMVVLPLGLGTDKQLDPDSVVSNKFTMARTTASNFLYVFLAKCSSKSEEIDYRPIFENFVQDLLTTVNKPEWPAAELMLSVLGNLLVASFVNKNQEMSLRVASLDYLGVVAARLRKDTVQSNLKLSTIDQIINEIKAEELKDDDGNMKGEVEPVKDDEERTQFLQRVLLDYLAFKGQADPALTYARHFYLAQWYQDNVKREPSPKGKGSNDAKRNSSRSGRKQPENYVEESSDNEDDEERRKTNGEADPLEIYRIQDARKKFLLSKIRPCYDSTAKEGLKKSAVVLQTYIDYDSAELISRYLASKRPFSQSFFVYLKQILMVLVESSVLIRTKAMKCLTSIVEVDPSVLGLKAMRDGVNFSFHDHSTSVREAAVDLVGKFVLSRPELIDKYYDMLSIRLLDTGVSVRKRVIKILKDICTDYPEFPKIPEICVKMIRRVNDEDGIRKLVMEVFQNMWFTPVPEKPNLDEETLNRKVINITEVVAASKDMGLDWFEQLLISLFKPKEDKDDSTKVSVEHNKALMTACRQIVNSLIETVLRAERCEAGGGQSRRLVACMSTLFLFAKIKPQLLVAHAITLQPYLSLKLQTQGDEQIISSVAQIMDIIVPLIEHPSDSFLSRLEEDSVKLIMIADPNVILSCVSCLGSLVNNVTRNFRLIRDCLSKYHNYLLTCKKWVLEGRHDEVARNTPVINRSLFVVGLILRHFDFTKKEVLDTLPADTRDTVFETLLFYLDNPALKAFALKAIGSVCIRHYELMLGPNLKALYHDILRDPNAPSQLKIKVLNNIELYLEEEEKRMIKQDQEWAKLSKQENLKEMGDVSSGMASTVIQLYLKEVLESFLHPDKCVRQAALKVIQLILSQGLVHPVQIVPYLICMSTDEERNVCGSADKQLQDIEKKYPGFIHMKAQSGIRLSFKLQEILQARNDAVRGFRVKEGELPGALNGFLYSILRSKQQRRALVLSVLKQFDEQVKTSLSQMLFLADNMAYFPYQVQDEPLFIIHHIDIMISVTGTNLLQSFREALLPNPLAPAPTIDPVTGLVVPVMDEEDDEDEDTLLSRVPDDTSTLQECITASQGCLLLLVLKQHLKTLYGFNDSKITQYSPSESAKVYEKAVNRKSNSKFNPKGTLQKIKQGALATVLDEQAKRNLLSDYLEFKHLIMNLDPDESDGEEAKSVSPSKSTMSTRTSEHAHVPTENAHTHDRVSEHQPQLAEPAPVPRVPKLTIVPPKPPDGKHFHHHHHRSHSHKARKTERHKKHHHKRKKSKLRSSEEESDNDYSDPDFLV